MTSAPSSVHAHLEAYATFRTVERAPELPAVLRGFARVDHGVSKYHPEARSEIEIWVHGAGPERVIKWLRSSGLRLSGYYLTTNCLPGFWKALPEDCVGALLAPDGDVALPDSHLYWRLVPLGEPLYTIGRPEAGSEHSHHLPHVLRAGGIPIVSDQLFATLRQLGAQGETGKITYRGANKTAYDSVQPGFRRFLIRPEYPMPDRGAGVAFLPESVPEDFGVCGMLRTREGQPEDRWYDIAVSARLCGDLRRLRKGIALEPIFRRGGVTHRWVSELEAVVDDLKAPTP